MNSARLIVVGVLVLILIGIGATMYFFSGKDSSKEDTGEALVSAPDFSLPDASGKNFSLESLKADVKIINFWASWSPYSKDELTSLSRLQEEYEGKVSIAALNRDTDPSDGRAFLKTLGLGTTVLFVYDKEDEYFKKVQGFAMPETLFLDADGNILAHQHGPMTYDEMRAQIETILQ